MKQLACDMCGSNDIVKQEGLFVCQVCGTKYSVEEARNMMFGETVEVEGTVKIDDSEEFNNLCELARRARDNHDYDYAIEYYNQILIKDPNNWEAQFYVSFFRLIKRKIFDISDLENFKNQLYSILNIINENSFDPLEARKACAVMTNEILEYVESYFEKEFLEFKNTKSMRLIKEYCDLFIKFTDILYIYGDTVITFGDSFQDYALESWKTSVKIHSSFVNKIKSNKRDNKKKIENYVNKIKQFEPTYKEPKYRSFGLFG